MDRCYPDAYHRWNWFRKEQWWPSYRDRMLASKGGQCGAVLKVLGDPQGKSVLDATCGLGRKTLIMQQLGMNVVASDACAYAVERLRNWRRKKAGGSSSWFRPGLNYLSEPRVRSRRVR